MHKFKVKGKIKGRLINKGLTLKSNNIISSGPTGSAAATSALVHALKCCKPNQKFFLVTDHASLYRKDELQAYAEIEKKQHREVNLGINNRISSNYKLILQSKSADVTVIITNAESSVVDNNNNTADVLMDLLTLHTDNTPPPSILLNITSVKDVVGTPLWKSIISASNSSNPFWLVERGFSGPPCAYKRLIECGHIHLVFPMYGYRFQSDSLPSFYSPYTDAKKSATPGDCHVFKSKHLLRGRIFQTDFISYQNTRV